MRASDAERESVVERLREASVEGRLTLAELTERTEAAYLAQTHAELVRLTSDLPGGSPAPQPAAWPVASPASSGRPRTWIVAVMSETRRDGTWRIDQEIGGVCVMGQLTLDLRLAEVRTAEVDIAVTCVMGEVKIIVPDGVDVQMSGMTIMGDKTIRGVQAPTSPDAPVVRIRANVLMGEVKVVGASQAVGFKEQLAALGERHGERIARQLERRRERMARHMERQLERRLDRMDRRTRRL